MSVALKLENITKSFGPNPVLKSVDLQINTGEIHGLVGENGSGKTTLLNILIGNPLIHESGGYKGNIYINGTPVEIRSPRQAIEMGLGMVHQEFTLLPGFTVTQNVKLGRENLIPSTRKLLGKNMGFIDKTRDDTEVSAILEKLGLHLNPRIKTADLSVNLKQYVELAREVNKNDLKVLILDEPTATLGKEDADRLISVLRELANSGTAILFISHRLEEVLNICHRVTVLREGEVVARLECGEPDFRLDYMANAMIGQEIAKTGRNSDPVKQGPPLMKFKNLSVDMPGEVIKNFNLQVYQGEILGITGLSGHGKLALGYGMMGMYPTSGQVMIGNSELDITRPTKVIGKDIYFLSDDRRQAGLLLNHSIMENIIFTATQRKNKFLRFSLGPLSMIDWKHSAEYARQSVKRYDIRCQSIHQKVGTLSGGNQQKVCLARAVTSEPKILFVAEPTRGIDIKAKQVILNALLQINEQQGTTVICVSSELGDLRQICDRIVVMYEGAVFSELHPDTPDSEFAQAFSGKQVKKNGPDN